MSTPEQDAPEEVQWASFPQRKCRQSFSMDGFNDHSCELPELHPGPDAARSSAASVRRRLAWQRDHPGWEKLASQADPFEDVTRKLQEGQ